GTRNSKQVSNRNAKLETSSSISEPFDRNPLEAAQIHFPGTQHREGIDFDEIRARWNIEVRQAVCCELAHDVGNLRFIQGVKDRELLAFLLVPNPGDGEYLCVGFCCLLQRLFHTAMLDHCCTHLVEWWQSIRSREAPVCMR